MEGTAQAIGYQGPRKKGPMECSRYEAEISASTALWVPYWFAHGLCLVEKGLSEPAVSTL